LYKLYNISSSSSSETPPSDSHILQDKINNLEKTLKILQSPVKTISFTPPSHYKAIQTNGEKIGMTSHINFCNKNIIQIPVIKK